LTKKKTLEELAAWERQLDERLRDKNSLQKQILIKTTKQKHQEQTAQL